jgi:hypothetical protein
MVPIGWLKDFSSFRHGGQPASRTTQWVRGALNYVIAHASNWLAKRCSHPLRADIVINLHPALPGQFDGANAIQRAFEAYQAGECTHTGMGRLRFILGNLDLKGCKRPVRLY